MFNFIETITVLNDIGRHIDLTGGFPAWLHGKLADLGEAPFGLATFRQKQAWNCGEVGERKKMATTLWKLR